MTIPAHLGGHYWNTHVNVGILEAFRDRVEFDGAIDIGCGPGGMLDRMIDRGIRALGIDGDPSVRRSEVAIHDFTKGICRLEGPYDLCWSTEFLEHLDKQYLSNFFGTLDQLECKWAIVTAAPPGRGGHHHVNCHHEPYWRKRFKENGWHAQPNMREFLSACSWPILCRPAGVITRSSAFDSLMVYSREKETMKKVQGLPKPKPKKRR